MLSSLSPLQNLLRVLIKIAYTGFREHDVPNHGASAFGPPCRAHRGIVCFVRWLLPRSSPRSSQTIVRLARLIPVAVPRPRADFPTTSSHRPLHHLDCQDILYDCGPRLVLSHGPDLPIFGHRSSALSSTTLRAQVRSFPSTSLLIAAVYFLLQPEPRRKAVLTQT